MSALYCRNDGRVYSYCTMFFENCNSIVYFCCISSDRLNGTSGPAGRADRLKGPIAGQTGCNESKGPIAGQTGCCEAEYRQPGIIFIEKRRSSPPSLRRRLAAYAISRSDPQCFSHEDEYPAAGHVINRQPVCPAAGHVINRQPVCPTAGSEMPDQPVCPAAGHVINRPPALLPVTKFMDRLPALLPVTRFRNTAMLTLAHGYSYVSVCKASA